MKSAFAKLLQMNPVQSSNVDFRAGGNGVPILTRASGQSTTGYQTMGLPSGSKPMPGGGANKTVLGIYRMGEDDGTSSASAIIGNPGDIFPPIEAPDRVNPERTFANVGNNVFQPQNDDLATHALLKRLGEQKFKAESQAPFEEYRAQQRLARDLEEVSRNASLSDLGTSRELIRNMAAERRQQNEDDYLRKMLDAGATPEAAKKEIEDVRNANAIQEARKIEDRGYQAKMLIQRLAMSRGVTPMVQEPLNQSSSIDNPQRSQAMSQAMGMPGEGFGTSPLDMNRQFLTPAFYKKFLRRSAVSQEASDEASAFGQLITGSGDADMIPPPSQGSFSMATLKGQERQQQIEMASEALASRLDAMRQRGLRIKKALPFPAVGKTILEALYKQKTKSVGSKVIFTPETIEDLAPLQLLMSINMNALSDKNGFNKLTKEVMKYTWKTGDLPAPRLTEHLRKVAYAMNNNEQDIRIPYASAVLPTSVANPTIYAELFQNIKNGAVPNLSNEISRGRRLFIEAESSDLRATDFEELPDIGGGATTAINAVPIPGAPNTTNVRTTNAIRQLQRAVRSRQRTAVTDVMGGIMNTVEFDTFPTMTIPQLKRELRAVKIKYSKNESKESLLAKLMAQFE